MVRNAYEGNGMLTLQSSLDLILDTHCLESFGLGIDTSGIRAVVFFLDQNWYWLMVSQTAQEESPCVGII